VNDPPPGASLREVLPGTPEQLDELIARFESYVDGATATARGLRAMDSGGWVGEAADAFWDSVGEVLRRLENGAAAFAEAALALRAYTATLRTAHVDARRALALFDEAERESRLWAVQQDTGQTGVVTATAGVSGTGVCLADPGEALRREARTLLDDARSSVAAAGAWAAERLNEAAEHAPNKPGWIARRWHNVTEFAGGAIEATTGMATFAFKLSPAYALINPDGFAENAVGLAEGLVFGATHPVDFAKAVVDWDTWAKSPAAPSDTSSPPSPSRSRPLEPARPARLVKPGRA
jgi:type VII secretion system ESX-1 substrate